jgi:putative Mg2+ transporter-C (MgtC) family protein
VIYFFSDKNRKKLLKVNLDFINENIPADIVLKIGVSLLLGTILGLEREISNKNAGLRTHILVCLGSTVFTVLSIQGFNSNVLQEGLRTVNDPARIAAQILTGIGFIGGGAVLHHGATITGLTTAATLWLSAAIGMAVGTGSYSLAVLTTIASFIVLVIIRKVEKKFISRPISKTDKIKVSVTCLKEKQIEVQEWFYSEYEKIHEIFAILPEEDKDSIKLTFIIDILEKDPVNVIYKKLCQLHNIESVSIKKVGTP